MVEQVGRSMANRVELVVEMLVWLDRHTQQPQVAAAELNHLVELVEFLLIMVVPELNILVVIRLITLMVAVAEVVGMAEAEEHMANLMIWVAVAVALDI